MGFDQKHYVPILKAKGGELRALKEASTTVRRSLTPLLEAPDVSTKPGEDDPVPTKSDEAHVLKVAKEIGKCWGSDRRVFIDGFYIEQKPKLADGREPAGALLDHLRDEGVRTIPVTGLDRVGDYDAAIKAAIDKDERGVCIRLWEPDLESDDLENQLASLVKFLGVKADAADLLIDFGPKVPPRSTIIPLVNAIPKLTEWRSLTLASSSFPSDMSEVAQFTTVELDREEWTNWTHTRSRAPKLMRMPTFSDYGINHPVLPKVDPWMMRASANIRYTSNTTYLIAKGEALPRAKDKVQRESAKEQYPKLAKMIIKHPAWCGPEFSWGDGYIQDCANKECVGGGREWRAVGTSHHLAFVVQQLASLPSP